MRYCILVLASAVAVVMISACRQEPSGQQPQVSRGPDEEVSGPGHKVETGQQPAGKAEPEVDEEPRGDNGAQGGEGPEAEEKVDQADPGEEPPLLLLDEEPPLLLEGGNGGSAVSAGPVADNSRCHHCHLNYVDEEIATVHARANIGCADCHGNCDEHIADESWASGGNGTPPEIMYPPEKVNPCCLKCHPKDKLDKAKHESFLAGKTEEKVCTDCHGDHRLKERKCKWR
jgi:hypothetical protein